MPKNTNRREPFFRFCAPDWRSDVPLRRCSYAARGLWIDMLSLMHDAEPYGELRDSGQPLQANDLVQLLGGTLGEVKRLLVELETRAVFSRCADGAIYSRRMRRDYLKAQTDRENGKGGGNPNLKREDNQSNNLPVEINNNHGVNPPDKAHGRTGAPGHFHLQKEESVLRTPPNDGDPKVALWREGLATLERLTRKPEGPSRKLLGKLLDAMSADHAALLSLIRRAEIEQPSDPLPWLIAASKTRDNATLPFDASDRWGLRRWLSSEPDVTTSTVDDGARTVLALGGFDVEALGGMVAEVARLPVDWAGSWKDLGQWLRDGIASDAILSGVRKLASWEGYEQPRSLAYFDRPVREAHARKPA